MFYSLLFKHQMRSVSFILLLMVSKVVSELSPLQLLGKDIQIVANNGSFQLVLPFTNSTDFTTLICFCPTQYQEKTIQDQDTTLCQFDISQLYQCVQVVGREGQTSDYSTFQRQFDVANLNTTDTLTQNIQVGNEQPVLQQIVDQIEVQAFQIRINLTNILQEQNFYHMISCESYRGGQRCRDFWKKNYVHTFNNPSYTGNFIVQRNHYCGVYQDKNGKKVYNHVFYGGTIREQVQTMFFAFLVHYLDGTSELNMWGGFDYTNDHTNKDMFCFSTANGQSFDALSLLLGAPYKDIAANIEGEESTSIIGNSFEAIDPFQSYFFIQYYRNFDTGDFIGDDRLFRKIGDSFAYAAYFHDSNMQAVSCTNKDYKHQLLFTIPIDLTLFNPLIYVQVSLMLLLILLVM